MEVVGLILGIPGFIAVALETYSSVAQSINSYRNLPREVENIFNSISLEEALFARYVDLLLATCMAERDRTEFVQTCGSALEYSQFYAQIGSWEGRFNELEREFTEQREAQDQGGTEADLAEFRAILFEMRLIKDVGIALEAIKVIRDTYFGPQGGEAVGAPEPQGGRMGAVGPMLRRRLNTAFRKRIPLGARSTSIRAVHSMLHGELETLKDRNRILNCSLNQRAARNNLRAAPPRSALITTGPPGLPAHRATRTLLCNLHNELLEHYVCCESHGFYLCLRTLPGNGTAAAGGNAGALVSFHHVPTVRFTALVTTRFPTAVIAAAQEIANSDDRLARLEIRDAPTGHQAPRCPQKLCDEIFSNPACQGAYRLDTFHLRLFLVHVPPAEQHRGPPASCSSSPSVITLRQLVLPELPGHRCDPRDLFLIAAGLVNAAPSLHSSPWAHSWSTRSIMYFRKLEDSDDIGMWKPYIAGSFVENDPPPYNAILRTLTILLVEIAGVDMDMGTGGCPDHDSVPKKVRSISRELARGYRDLVERLYKAYQESFWEDDVSVDGMIDNLCHEIARELHAMAEGIEFRA